MQTTTSKPRVVGRRQIVRELERRIRAAGGNQEKAAADLGISPSYLSGILNDDRDPGDKVLKALGYTQVARYTKADVA